MQKSEMRAWMPLMTDSSASGMRSTPEEMQASPPVISKVTPEMTVIAPYNEQSARWTEAPDIVGTMIFADPDSPDAYLCVAPDPSKGKKRAVVIETNEEMRRILRLCNPAAFRK